jgi:hypothetical protein
MIARRTLPNVVRLQIPADDRIRLGMRIRELPAEMRVAIAFLVRCRR